MKLLRSVLSTAALMAASTLSHASLLIDDFATSQSKVEATTTGSTDYSRLCGIATAIGGCRELFVERTGGTGSEDGDVSVKSSVSSGSYKVSSDSEVVGRAIVRWDGAGDSDISTINLGLGGVDFLNNSGGVKIDVKFADPGQPNPFVNILLRAYTTAGDYTTFLLPADATPTPDTVFIPWAAFMGLGTHTGAGVDLENVYTIEALVNWDNLQTAFDITVDLVEAPLPEPATLALLGVALAAAGAASRRRLGQ